MKKRLWWGIGALLIISTLAFGAWWFWGKPAAPLKVNVAVTAPISMHEDVYATGTVVPVSRQEVRVLNPGRVSKVAVKVGDTVRAGQLLVQLDSTLADAQVAQAKASVDAAQANVNGAQANLDALRQAQSTSALALTPANTVNPGAVKQAEGALAQSQAGLKQAQAALKVAQAQQAQTTCKATIPGTVLEVNVQEGNISPVQQPLVLVADLSQINVEAQLNEVDAGKVQLGQKVTVTSKVLGSAAIQGTLTEIAPEAVTKPSVQGNTSPTVDVKVRLDHVSGGLKPGFTVNIEIVTASKDGVLAVPQEALFQEGNKNYVFRVEANRLHKVEVKMGIGDDTHQEITAGLKSGDMVVLNPSNQLTEGMSVTPESGSGSS